MSLGYIPFRLHCDLNIYHFNIVDGVPEVPFDMTRVHPIKQREVYEIYKLFTKSDLIKNAWIFGSSVSYFCHPKSDTDILIYTELEPEAYCDELKNISLALYRICRVSYDLLRKEELSKKDVFNFIGLERGVKIK